MTLRQLQYASERSPALSPLPSRSLRISASLCFSLPLSPTPGPLFVDRVLFFINSMAKSPLDSLPVEGQLRFNQIEITHIKEGRRHTQDRSWQKACWIKKGYFQIHNIYVWVSEKCLCKLVYQKALCFFFSLFASLRALSEFVFLSAIPAYKWK